MNMRVSLDGASYPCVATNTDTPLYCSGQYAFGMLCAMGYISARRSNRHGTWWALGPMRMYFSSQSSRERVVLAFAVFLTFAFVAWITVIQSIDSVYNDARCVGHSGESTAFAHLLVW